MLREWWKLRSTREQLILGSAFLLLFSSIGMNGLMINVIIGHAIFLLALPLVTISLGMSADPG